MKRRISEKRWWLRLSASTQVEETWSTPPREAPKCVSSDLKKCKNLKKNVFKWDIFPLEIYFWLSFFIALSLFSPFAPTFSADAEGTPGMSLLPHPDPSPKPPLCRPSRHRTRPPAPPARRRGISPTWSWRKAAPGGGGAAATGTSNTVARSEFALRRASTLECEEWHKESRACRQAAKAKAQKPGGPDAQGKQ